MDAKRIVPVLEVLGDQVVEPGDPAGARGLGHPADWAARMEMGGADSLLFRERRQPGQAPQVRAGWLQAVAAALFIPFALEAPFGGLEELEAALAAGADRVILPAAVEPALLAAAAGRFGRSRVGVALTLRPAGQGWRVERARPGDGPEALSWMAERAELGAGEILLRLAAPGPVADLLQGAAQLPLAILVETAWAPGQVAELLHQGADGVAFPASVATPAGFKAALGGFGLTLRG